MTTPRQDQEFANLTPLLTTPSADAELFIIQGGQSFRVTISRLPESQAGGGLTPAQLARLLPDLPALGERNDKIAKFVGDTLTWEADAEEHNLPAVPTVEGRYELNVSAENTLSWAVVAGVTGLANGTSLPATPSLGDVFILTATEGANEAGFYICRTAGTWNHVAGGSGRSITFGTAAPTGGSEGDLYFRVNASNVIQSISLRGNIAWSTYTLPSGGTTDGVVESGSVEGRTLTLQRSGSLVAITIDGLPIWAHDFIEQNIQTQTFTPTRNSNGIIYNFIGNQASPSMKFNNPQFDVVFWVWNSHATNALAVEAPDGTAAGNIPSGRTAIMRYVHSTTTWTFNLTPSSGGGLDQTAVDARVQAAKGTSTPVNTPSTPSAGTSNSWAPDDHDHGIAPGTGGMADGVANSVDLSLSGNSLSITVGRSGTLADLTDSQDLSSISGTSELPRWHHVAAESQFAGLRTAGIDRLVADRDLTITAVNTITEPSGTQITSVKNGDLFIWNEQTTPNRWERFGNIIGLTQTQVDARIAALVADWAEAGNSDVFPLAKVDGAQGATQAPMRIRWDGVRNNLNAARFATGQESIGNTRDGVAAPIGIVLNEFLGIWIGTAEASITDIEEGGVSVLGDLFPNIAAGEPLTVLGTAGTVFRTATAVSVALWEGHIFRATLTPLHFGDVVDARIRDDVSHWALDGDTTTIPSNKLPAADGVADSVDLSVAGNDLTLTVGRSGTLSDLTDTVTLPAGGGTGSTSVRSRIGHVDSVSVANGALREVALTEDMVAGNDYQIAVTDDSTGNTGLSQKFSGEHFRSKTAAADVPTTINNSITSVLTLRENNTDPSMGPVARWVFIKGRTNRELYVSSTNSDDLGPLTIEVWKYPRALQGVKGDKGDPGDPGAPGTPGSGAVTFGSGAGEVAEWAEGNNTDAIPFGKIEVGETQGTVAVRLGWDNQQDLGGVGVQTGTTGTGVEIPVAPVGATRIWVAVRVDNASDVTQIAVGGYNQLGSSGYFNGAGVELTFNSETWFRFTTRVLDDLERTVLDDRTVTVRTRPDNLDEHIDRRAEDEVRRYRRDVPVIEGITLSDSAFTTLNSAGQSTALTWPSALTQTGGTGEVALADLRALRDAGQILPYSANVTLLGSSPTVDNRENINDGDLTTFATFNGGTKTAVVVDWGRVVRRPRVHVWANGVSAFSFRGVNANGHDAGHLFNVSTVNGKTVWDAGERDLRGMFLQQQGGAASVNIFLIYVEDTRLTEVTYDAATRQLLGLNLALPEATDSAAGLLSATDKTTYDGYQAQIDALGVDPTTTVGGDLLNVIAERIAVHTTLTLGQVAPSNLELGFSRVTPIVGSFDPAIPTNDLTNLVKVFMSRENNVDNRPPGGTINIQFRLFLEVTEATATRSYQGKRVVWGPTGTSPALEEHTWTWGWHSQGRNTYYTDVVAHRPTAGGQTVTFNLEDVVAETYETFPGTPWIWHATIATVQEHISNADIPVTNPSTTFAPTQRAVTQYVGTQLAGTVESVRSYYMNGQSTRFAAFTTRSDVTVLTPNAGGRMARLTFNNSSSGTNGEELFNPDFTVTWMTSAQAEASNIDQVGAEVVPANHIFTLPEGLYNVRLMAYSNDQISRTAVGLFQVATGTDIAIQQQLGPGDLRQVGNIFSDDVEETFDLAVRYLTVPSGGASFYCLFGLGGTQSRRITGYLTLEKLRT